jgi:predicted RNase H-like nuclease (RuvC/YqgF family)
MVAQKEMEVRRLEAYKTEIDAELEDCHLKIQVLENELGRMQREEIRWRERYDTIINQKDERIRILEKGLQSRLSSSYLPT